MNEAAPLFHHAFAISDIGSARDFYVGRLGCREGRSTDHWIDFDLFGHHVLPRSRWQCDRVQDLRSTG